MKIKRDMNNLELADLMRSVACALVLEDNEKNKFRIIAYERSADAIEHLSSEAKDLYDEGKLSEIPGVGENITKHLSEIFTHGESKYFEKILGNLKPAIFELIKLPYIGPKTAYKLTSALKISNINPIDSLKRYAMKGAISKIEGFGSESEKEIIQAIAFYKQKTVRHLFNYAENIANEVINWMKQEKSCEKIDVLGSLRRKASTIGDIDISIATNNKSRVINHFCNYKNVGRIIEKGDTTASILLPGNVQIDLMTTNPNCYGSLFQHFTGSKHHNIKLRDYALSKGLSLSEYGIKIIKNKSQIQILNDKLKKFKTEEEFYKYLGMEWIPPELREGNEEIEFALQKKLPKLVELDNIKGDLQIHSDFNVETSHDLGISSYKEIIDIANDLGYLYIAFTDHNPSRSKHSEKQITDILKRKIDYVNQANSYSINFKKGVYVFNSLEIDILPDGKLPLSDKQLEMLDFALVSIHSSFSMDINTMTKRVIRALSHPKVKIFAHPTARKINEREGILLDWLQIFEYCLKNFKFVEINADPMRLDLPDHLVREAVKLGVKLTIGTDSHHKEHLKNIKYGVNVACRGWAEKKDIVNTFILSDVKNLLLK